MFRLSKMADYGIMVMVHFAQDLSVVRHSARGIAEATGLPQPTVVKLLKSLTRSGMLVSHRGAHGGYSLSRPPEEVNVVDMVSAIDGPIHLTDCSSEEAHNHCDYEHTCPVRTNWQIINETVVLALANLSLADMADPLPQSPLAMTMRVSGLDTPPGEAVSEEVTTAGRECPAVTHRDAVQEQI